MEVWQLDFKELEYAISIAETGSVTKSANILYVSQPTLSKFVQKLAKELKQPIFKRVGNRFKLTYAGEIYIHYAKQILNLKHVMDSALNDIIEKEMGFINIGFPGTRAGYLLPLVLPDYQALHPNIHINVVEYTSTSFDDMLLHGSLDIAFYNFSLERSHIDYEVIEEEDFVLVASKDHPISAYCYEAPGSKYPRIPLSMISDSLCLLGLRNQRSRQIVDNILHTHNIKLKNVMELSNIYACIRLAATGYGICFASEAHLQHVSLPPQAALYSFDNPTAKTIFVAATRKNHSLPQYMRDFVDIVRKHS